MREREKAQTSDGGDGRNGEPSPSQDTVSEADTCDRVSCSVRTVPVGLENLGIRFFKKKRMPS